MALHPMLTEPVRIINYIKHQDKLNVEGWHLLTELWTFPERTLPMTADKGSSLLTNADSNHSYCPHQKEWWKTCKLAITAPLSPVCWW